MKRNKYNIGIIGRGFVGSAVENGFSGEHFDDYIVRVFDANPEKTINSLESVVNKSDIVFISVPTPSFEDGEIDLNILENCLSDISKISNNIVYILMYQQISIILSNMIAQCLKCIFISTHFEE